MEEIFKGEHCQKCGTKYVKFPIKGQPEKSLGENYREKTIIWKNLFRIDLFTIVMVASILLMTYGYKHDIAKCNEVMTNPYQFCVKAGCLPNPIYEPFQNFNLNQSFNFGT